MARPSKTEFMRVYEECGRNLSAVAKYFKVPRPSVYNWSAHFGVSGKGRSSKKPTDDVCKALYDEYDGNITRIAKHLGLPRGSVSRWYCELDLPGHGATKFQPIYPIELRTRVENGHVVIGSDAHFWPGEDPTPAYRAFIKALKKLKPKVVVLNGDILDGARISRHSPIGWDDLPMVSDEIHECQIKMAEISRAAGNAEKYFTLGNHDVRLEQHIVTHARELEGVEGTRLKDHFLSWNISRSLKINDNTLVIHRWKSGRYAPFNNALSSGMNIVTGHLHSQCVHVYTDYNETRYGVDAGTLANPKGPQFLYTEGVPLNWRSGFCALKFEDSRLLPPQLATDDGEGRVYMSSVERLI